MKKMWLALFLGALMVACQPEGKNTNATGEEVPGTSEFKSIGDGQAAPPINPGDSPLIQSLTKDFWVFEFYVIPGNMEEALVNKGRWYDLKPDGTFESGHWEELTGNGSWRLENREGKQFLILDSTVDAEDSEWEIKMSADADAMSWVGTENYGRNSHMLKVTSLLTRPTKAQFGVQ